MLSSRPLVMPLRNRRLWTAPVQGSATLIQSCSRPDPPAPVSFMERNRDRHGPIFSVKLGALKRCALIGEPSAAWQVLSGDPSTFRMGPTNAVFRPVLGEQSVFVPGRVRLTVGQHRDLWGGSRAARRCRLDQSGM